MSPRPVRATGGAILLGLAWFMVLMSVSIGLVMLNARVTPSVPWFPVPVLALCLGSAVWAERRWQIGLTHPSGVEWGRIYALAFTTTLLGVCVAILQGASFGMVRRAELGPAGTGAWFGFAYAFVMPLVAAILAEVGFRGVMQGRLHTLLAPAPAILLVAIVNTAAHRWGPALAAQWVGYFVLLAGLGYVRWLGGSLLPPLAAHCATNLAMAAALWRFGPFDQGALAPSTLWAIGAGAAAGLAATVVLARDVRPRPAPQHPATSRPVIPRPAERT